MPELYTPDVDIPQEPPPRIVGSQILFIGHQTIGIAGERNVQVSPMLPSPCIITSFSWLQSNAQSSTLQWSFDVYLSNNDSYELDDAALGLKLTQHAYAGASPPDMDVFNPLSIAGPFGTIMPQLLLNIPVYTSPAYIKTVAYQTILAICHFWCYFTLDILDHAPADPTTGIIPRGTPTAPYCVKLCEPIPTLPSPGVPTAPTPPPTAPTPPAPAALDPLALPLPNACPVDPQNPLSARPRYCEVP